VSHSAYTTSLGSGTPAHIPESTIIMISNFVGTLGRSGMYPLPPSGITLRFRDVATLWRNVTLRTSGDCVRGDPFADGLRCGAMWEVRIEVPVQRLPPSTSPPSEPHSSFRESGCLSLATSALVRGETSPIGQFFLDTSQASLHKKQSKAVPLHAMEALWGRGNITPTHS
jgi:hypothetical protein